MRRIEAVIHYLRTGAAGTALWVAAALICAAGAVTVLPRAVEAVTLLYVEDDPAALADRQLDQVFDAGRASREIEQALAAKDSDLARSFVDLAQARSIALPPELLAQVEAAEKTAASPASKASAFARGLVYGEPDDLVSFAGTALGDLFVFGDIRDLVREGSRLANGQEADKLILGLAGVGIAITAGTYATLGAGAPARIGLTVAKAARKTGRLGARMGDWMAASLRRAVDWSALRRGMAGASVTEPALAVRASREAVKVGKADNLLHLARDVGHVQMKAGTQAALDGLKVAQSPRELARVAKLAEKNGSKTRAILKTLGRGAIALSMAMFNIAAWIFSAVMMLWGFVSSLKAWVERSTRRRLQKKKARRRARAQMLAPLPQPA